MIYIALLRGVNVSGKNSLKMESLRASLASLKFKNLKTYIQSGNIVFEADNGLPHQLELAIQKKIAKDFGFLVPVTVRTFKELISIVDKNPFLKIESIKREKLHVTFLSARPKKAEIEKLKAFPVQLEQFELLGKDIFLYCPEGYGGTKFTNNLFERMLLVQATTRNWKTITTLIEIAEKRV